MADRLSKLDDKINSIYEIITTSSKSIENRLYSVEKQLDILIDDKNTKKDQNVKNGEESKEEPLQLNVMNSIFEAMNVELVTMMGDHFNRMEEKILQNKNLLNRNYGELMTLRQQNLHTKNGNNNQMTPQTNRKERREQDRQHTELISEILSVVKNEIQQRVVDDEMNRKSQNRSMTLMNSPQKGNQTSKFLIAKKGGKAATTNNSTTFAFDRDIKVMITLYIMKYQQ